VALFDKKRGGVSGVNSGDNLAAIQAGHAAHSGCYTPQGHDHAIAL
jgi:hypothetical protein